MNIEDLNEYVNEQSIRGKLTRELLGVLSDFQSGKIDASTKKDLCDSIEAGFHAEDACVDEQTSKFLRKAVEVVCAIL